MSPFLVEWFLVVDWAKLGKVIEAVQGVSGLGVASLELQQVFILPSGALHVGKDLGMAEMLPHGIVEELDPVRGCVILLEKVGCLELQGAEQVVGGVFGPFHQVEVVVEFRSVSMLKALCKVDVQVEAWS